MAAFKSAYLISGDDHARVAERRSSLRAVAEAQGGTIETLEGDEATPEAVAAALCAMTFATGRRFIVVDGAERWKDEDVRTHLVAVLAAPDPETTVAFFAREEGRYKTPAALKAAVEAAGGDVRREDAVAGKELPGWTVQQARRLSLTLDLDAARALVALVGERPQRILRELEKLVLEHGEGATLGPDEVEESVADAAARQVWGLADALVAGDRERAVRLWIDLRDRGEATQRLLAMAARRLREVHAFAVRLAAGESAAEIASSAKGSPWAVKQRLKEASRADEERLGRAVAALAQLERDTRGDSALNEDTLAVRAVVAAAG